MRIDSYFPEITDFAERTKLKHVLRNSAIMNTFGQTGPQVFVQSTYRCNAQCKYCFEQTYASDQLMTDETALNAAKFIKEKAIDNKVAIVFFGGEPTVYMRPFDIITDYLNERNVDYISTMTTNGYLLDTLDTYKLRYQYRLSGVQMSLDGDDPEYSLSKLYKNGDTQAVQKLLHNIEYIVENSSAHMLIRLNISLTNANSIYRFIDKVSPYVNKYPKRITIYCTALNSARGFELTDTESKYLADKEAELGLHLINNHIPTMVLSTPTQSANACMANYHNHYMITPTGGVVACSESHDCEGKITTIDDSNEEIKAIRLEKAMMEEIELCKECPRYVICNITKGCPSSRGCNKQFQERLLARDQAYMKKKQIDDELQEGVRFYYANI